MKNDKPLIFHFKTPGGFYIYDVNKNTLLQVKKDLYHAILQDEHASSEINNSVSSLKELGFLSGQRIKEIIHPADLILKDILDNKIHKITLQITQQCNFRCHYCSYSDNYENRSHSGQKMSIEVAKKGIDFLINHSREVSRIDVGFYGGEPLLEFEFIKECIEYGEKKAEGKSLSFSLTTNGSLITEEIIAYFLKHNVSLTISLDGPREVHDKNRKFAGNSCGTFDVVMDNVRMIREKYPEFMRSMMFNAVLDPENDFSCLNDFFLNGEAFQDSDVMATLINDMYRKNTVASRDEFYEKMNYERFKTFLCVLNRVDRKNISKVSLNEFDSLKRFNENLGPTERLFEKGHHSGPCIPGALRLFMDAKGDFYPCERVSEASKMMVIGNVYQGFDIKKVRHILNIGKLTEEDCKECWAIRLCGLCAAFADTLDDLSSEKKSQYCISSKMNVLDNLRDFCMLKEFGYEFEDDGQRFDFEECKMQL